jgi:hypothetical protein
MCFMCSALHTQRSEPLDKGITMNSIRKSLLIGMTVLSLGTVGAAARADDTPAAGRHGQQMTQEQRDAKMAEHKAKFAAMVAKRQAALHDKLKLSAAQEPAWASFVAATTPQWPAGRPDRASAAQLSAPERMEKHLEMSKQHIAKQETRLAAVKAFYAQLTPEQKKTFDEAAKHHHGRMHGGMMRHG